MTPSIPIRNLWLLQFFASHLFRTDGYAHTGSEPSPEDLPDLVGRILADEVVRRIHRGLSVGFRAVSRNERRVHGRINVLPTHRHRLLDRGQVNCTFDEIVTDIPSNRLVRAALERAAVLVPENPRYRSLALQLRNAGVVGQPPQPTEISQLRRQRLLERDRTMLSAAELLLSFAVPTTDAGDRWQPLPGEDEQYLRVLFEWAAYGVYRHHLQPAGWTVRHGTHQKWQVSDQSQGMEAVLPRMKLDIVLERPESDGGGRRKIVIDTKFTSVTTAGHYRDEVLKTGHLYQIYAYLMSQPAAAEDAPSEGLMLYPVTGGRFDEYAVIQGSRIRFATVDLTAAGSELKADFLRAIA